MLTISRRNSIQFRIEAIFTLLRKKNKSTKPVVFLDENNFSIVCNLIQQLPSLFSQEVINELSSRYSIIPPKLIPLKNPEFYQLVGIDEVINVSKVTIYRFIGINQIQLY